MPLVSIGIPFLNPGDHMPAAIRSVFAQTYKDWELILVDDGSTDGSLEAARAISSKRVSVHTDGERKGLPARLNQIAKLARGEYLVRMDADDIMHPRRIESQIEFLRNQRVDAVGTQAWIIDKSNRICGRSFPNEIRTKRDRILTTLKWGWPIHATLAANRLWFLQNPYDLNFPRAEDRELFVRVLEKSKIDEIKECLYFYRRPDTIGVQAYLQGYSSERRVLGQYGRHLVGGISTVYMILRSYAKSLILETSYLLRFHNSIVKKKYIPINEQEYHLVNETLRLVLATKVPGWNN